MTDRLDEIRARLDSAPFGRAAVGAWIADAKDDAWFLLGEVERLTAERDRLAERLDALDQCSSCDDREDATRELWDLLVATATEAHRGHPEPTMFCREPLCVVVQNTVPEELGISS